MIARGPGNRTSSRSAKTSRTGSGKGAAWWGSPASRCPRPATPPTSSIKTESRRVGSAHGVERSASKIPLTTVGTAHPTHTKSEGDMSQFSQPTPKRNPGGKPSRRQFIKTGSALVVGGTMLGTNLRVARSAHLGSSDEIKVALIGCGGRGKGAALQALETEGPVTLWACADAFQDQVEL